MSRRKNKKMLSIMPIMCITTIVILNFIGISYGVWSDSLNISFLVSTGSINPEFYLGDTKEKIVENDNGKITLTLSDDNRTLYINGECYPTFNENLLVEIINKGSIPVILEDIDDKNDDEIITQLDIFKDFFIEANEDDQFNINIQAVNQNNQEEDSNVYEESEYVGLVPDKVHVLEYKLKFIQGVQ